MKIMKNLGFIGLIFLVLISLAFTAFSETQKPIGVIVTSVDANSHGTYPLQQGDLVVDLKSDDVYVCKTAPTANTAAALTEITTGM